MAAIFADGAIYAGEAFGRIAWREMAEINVVNPVDRKLAALLEEGLPLAPEPFDETARELGVTQETALSMVSELLNSGFLRRFGIFWDFTYLGYSGFLFGASVSGEKIDEVAGWVNGLDFVTHNYLRRHDLNLWFTAILSGEDHAVRLGEVLGRKGLPFAAFGPRRRIKLCPSFARDFEDCRGLGIFASREAPATIDPFQRRILAVLQGGMTPQRRPFAGVAELLGTDEGDLLSKLAELKSSGMLRRFGAAVNHNAAGYLANSLMAWDFSDIPDDEASQIALEAVGPHRWASHCYFRRVIASNLKGVWRYNLFVMVHARDDKELGEREALLARAMAPTAGKSFISMRTEREFKKISFSLKIDDGRNYFEKGDAKEG
jgi:DNA-binding Lrp family transcriptional regulator